MMRFIFIADDFGASAGSAPAFLRLCSGPIARSLTVLAHTASFDIPADLKTLPLAWGAHLYLTDFEPLTERIKKIFPGPGDGTKRRLAHCIATGRLTQQAIHEEFAAQIAKLETEGIKISFIDSHQNVHSLPLVLGAVQKLADSLGLRGKIRPVARLNFNLRLDIKSILSRAYAKFVDFKPQSRVLIGCPGYNCARIDMKKALASWKSLLNTVKMKNYDEIVVPCHPITSPAESELYTSAAFHELFLRSGIALERP